MKLVQLCAAAILLCPSLALAQDVIQETTLPPSGMQQPSNRTISWYMAHNDERKAAIQHCDDDPGHLENDPDCINAKKADNQVGVDGVKQGVDNTIQGASDFFHKF